VTVEELPERHAETYDVFLSFTRASTGSADQAERLEKALTAKGLRVFRDVRIDEFAGITGELVDALAGSRALVAYYTREYPERFACQWELTAAFIAAQREGDPRRRVLVVNPEADERHISPIELADAKFAGNPSGDADLERLVTRIAARVATLTGPLGARPTDRALPPAVLAQRRLVGRYPEMWRVHTSLHAMDFPAVHKPAPERAVVVTGLPGMGKSSLAARYAYLYRDAYPGGVFWVEAIGSYTDRLREIAEYLGLPVAGVEPGRLRTMVADALLPRGRVLWIVDDIPPALPATMLDEVFLPADNVRTLLTSRSHVVGGDLPEIPLGGLGEAEARELLGVSTSDGVRDFVRRCGGHPLVLLAAVNDLRYRPGPVTPDLVPDLLRRTDPDVGAAVAGVVDGVDPVARQVLRVAGVLAPAPFPPGLAHAVVPGDVAAAVQDLERRGLLHVVDGRWLVHALVSAAAGVTEGLADRVAEALLPLLPTGDRHLSDHARRLGENAHIAVNTRRRLLRHVVADHESKGDPVGAAEVLPALSKLTPPASTPVVDLLTGARVRLAHGRPADARDTARQALANAGVTDDFRARHRARLLLAQALDQLGDHAAADEACWTELADRLPGWLREDGAAEERVRTQLALASATLHRGAPRDALAIVEPIVTALRGAPPGPLRDDLAPMATLELARLRQITGKARVARTLAEEVVRHYRDNGMGAHARLLEAESVWADAFLTLDLAELDGKEANWQRAEQKLREMAARYADQWGADSAVAIAARVRADRALIALGRPQDALRALAEAESYVQKRLGRHRLLYRVRYTMGQAHAQLHEFDRQRDILLDVLPAQTALLGGYHPETLETTLDLGIAYAMTGDRAKAVPLVDEAASALRRGIGINTDLSAKATTAQGVVRLPFVVLKAMGLLGRLF
jgi:tetratricopeptide (TPR) repeat protein